MLSEVASIREAIAKEYLVAKFGLSGFASGSTRHKFITAKMERMQEEQKKLERLVGNQAAAMVAETLANLPEKPTRSSMLFVLQSELPDTEETAYLFDEIQAMWETCDTLTARFGAEVMQAILNALSQSKDV